MEKLLNKLIVLIEVLFLQLIILTALLTIAVRHIEKNFTDIYISKLRLIKISLSDCV